MHIWLPASVYVFSGHEGPTHALDKITQYDTRAPAIYIRGFVDRFSKLPKPSQWTEVSKTLRACVSVAEPFYNVTSDIDRHYKA